MKRKQQEAKYLSCDISFRKNTNYTYGEQQYSNITEKFRNIPVNMARAHAVLSCIDNLNSRGHATREIPNIKVVI